MKLIKISITVIVFSVVAFSCKPKSNDTPLANLLEQQAGLETRIKLLEDSVAILDKLIEEKDTSEKNYALVTLDTVKNRPISEDVMFQGSVEADKSIMLSPETSGVIRSLLVREGQNVSRGRVLARLDSEIINKNILEVKKSLELAEYMLEKQQNLKNQGIGAEANYIQAKNQKESLESRLASLKTQASKSNVVAPFSGYVDEIFTKLGEVGNPGMPMLRLVNLEKVVVKAEVSESYLMDIQVGDKVSLNFPSIGKTVTNAKITSLGKYINPTNRTFPIHIELSNRDRKILPNLIAEVIVEKDFIKEAILVPSESILEDNKGNKYVFVYENGVAIRKAISVLFVKNEVTQIAGSSEVKEGDIVIRKGASALNNGDKVTELN